MECSLCELFDVENIHYHFYIHVSKTRVFLKNSYKYELFFLIHCLVYIALMSI